MSRAGRFSTGIITSDPEDFSQIGGSKAGNLSDMSEEETDEEDAEYSSESSFDESTMSPTTLAERDEFHRLKDEQRIQLDLSKHRELLVDSQKMNQSLKKCLNWTEELIKDAQKALAYKVLVSDVKLRGRVLNAEEDLDQDQEEESKALLSPWTPPHRATDPLEDSLLQGSDRTDRDSGVDVDGLQASVFEIQDSLSLLGIPLTETPSRPPRMERPGVERFETALENMNTIGNNSKP